MLEDQRQGWEMNSDGTYSKKKVKNLKKELGTHMILMNKARNRALF